MFNNRDLALLGVGGLLAVLCLLLPFLFAGKVIAGGLVLVAFMVLALLRLGPDRVPLEVWLLRRIRYALGIRQFVHQQKSSTRVQPGQYASSPAVAPARGAPQVAQASGFLPLDLAWSEVGVYPLMSVFLGVVGVYFVVWLARGGAQQIALWLSLVVKP